MPETSSLAAASAGKLPLFTAFAWLGICLLSVLLSGCPRFGWSYGVFLAFTLALTLSELAFMDAVYRKGQGQLLPAWKKFSGYALVLSYVFQALPRVAWRNDGLIGESRAVFLFALSILSLVAGFVTFTLMGRPSVQASFGLITPEEVGDRALRKKNRTQRRKPGFLNGLLEWVDAIAFAAIAVIVINIFVFQLYVIPSESMVPSFLKGDRPFTVKLTMGPRLPLTEWRLPFIDGLKRGDIITIANPRYPENREVNVKKQLAQFVYMLTFTAVNIDLDANGYPKADPLVKRLVGVPGEKLMMVDDVLYAKRVGEADFVPVEDDRKWARVDLWKEDLVPVSKISTIPIDQRGRELLDAWDARKNGLDLVAMGASLKSMADRIEAKAARARGRGEPVPASDVAALRDEALRGVSNEGAAYIAGYGASAADLSLSLAAMRSPRVALALATYARDGASAALVKPVSAYEKGSRAFGLLVKANLLNRIERNLDLLAGGAAGPGDGLDAIAKDVTLARLQAEAKEILNYFLLYDARNFPVFPEGDRYLGPNEYFAMGDNRYNSLDFRFSERSRERPLDKADPSSALYRSALAPFSLERRYIEGKASFILWPFSRAGKIRQ